jgi:hypothetical protein
VPFPTCEKGSAQVPVPAEGSWQSFQRGNAKGEVQEAPQLALRALPFNPHLWHPSQPQARTVTENNTNADATTYSTKQPDGFQAANRAGRG